MPIKLPQVEKWIRQYGIRKVRMGIISFVMDKLENWDTEEIVSAYETRLKYGQPALLKADAQALLNEIEFCDDDIDEIVDAIAGPLAGDAVATKEGIR